MGRGLGYWMRAPHTARGNLACGLACFLVAMPLLTVSVQGGAAFLGISFATLLRATFS